MPGFFYVIYLQKKEPHSGLLFVYSDFLSKVKHFPVFW